MAWKSFEDAKKFGIDKGLAFLVMFGDRPITLYKTEYEAKSHARMWRDSDKIPDVRIKRIY